MILAIFWFELRALVVVVALIHWQCYFNNYLIASTVAFVLSRRDESFSFTLSGHAHLFTQMQAITANSTLTEIF